MALDPQAIANALVNLDEEMAVNVITTVLVSRPELAPAVVTFAVPDLTYPPSKVLVDRRATGTIKSISADKGFGFIECQELHEVFGNDVFVHIKQLGSLSVGQQVNFAIALNKDNKPQAFDIVTASGLPTAPNGTPAPPAPSLDAAAQLLQLQQLQQMNALTALTGAGDASWAQMSAWMDSKGGKGGGKKRPNDVKEELGQFMGTIKSFNENTGYGFITCPDLQAKGYTNDVFLHHQQAVGHQVGSTIMFTCYINQKGQPQAKDLIALDSAAAASMGGGAPPAAPPPPAPAPLSAPVAATGMGGDLSSLVPLPDPPLVPGAPPGIPPPPAPALAAGTAPAAGAVLDVGGKKLRAFK